MIPDLWITLLPVPEALGISLLLYRLLLVHLLPRSLFFSTAVFLQNIVYWSYRLVTLFIGVIVVERQYKSWPYYDITQVSYLYLFIEIIVKWKIFILFWWKSMDIYVQLINILSWNECFLLQTRPCRSLVDVIIAIAT